MQSISCLVKLDSPTEEASRWFSRKDPIGRKQRPDWLTGLKFLKRPTSQTQLIDTNQPNIHVFARNKLIKREK